MNKEPIVVHVIVTDNTGLTIHKEAIAREDYSTDSNFNRAIKNKYTDYQKLYPRQLYRIEILLSHSRIPISLNSISTLANSQ